ncbi:MAG: hypothetical protein IT385_21675 [Deltaproteobacteria bacterium]|nr:hypothetical protein [Deltaproteobacteria bacterium]
MLALGPAAVVTLARATAFPARVVATDALLEASTPGLSEARRAALRDHLAREVDGATRAFVEPPERALDLAIRAARDALERAGIAPGAIAGHVHATSTPSRWTGPEAARIGKALGLAAALLDVRSGCTGGLWALVQGAWLASQSQAPVLVTAADALSRTFPVGASGAVSERMLPLTMGDGAAALVLAPGGPGRGLARAVFLGRPEHADDATVPDELPPRGGEAWALAGDPERFAEASERALSEALAALAPPADARVVVLTPRAATGRRVAPGAWRASQRAHGHVGAASALVALAEIGPGETALVSAGGGLSAGAALWSEASP